MHYKYPINPVSRLHITLLSRFRHMMIAASVLSLLLVSSTVQAQNSVQEFEGEAQDAWIAGQAVTMLALSEHASAFDIDINVESGRITLTGEVDSDINKELAAELVRGVDGVTSVDVNASSDRSFAEGDQDLKRWFDQTTITAEIKSRLLANSTTGGFDIDVDTQSEHIVLRGTVQNRAERELAGMIAENSSYGRQVRNNLVITGN